MDLTQESPEGYIKERAGVLSTYRDPYLNRAYNYAKVTLPYIINETEDNSSSEVQLDYNSIGAEYTNHLANRYMNDLFPANRSFFKLRIQDDEITGESDAKQDELLVQGERAARWQFEKRQCRMSYLDALKHCIVTGNALVYYPPDQEIGVQTYALDEYYVMRAPDGTILEIITEDKIAIANLDPDIKQQVISELDLDVDSDLYSETAIIYTYIRLDPENNKQYVVDQAIEGIPLDGTLQTYPKELLPWMPLVWNLTRRENYGRGLIEDHYGSFWALSVLTEALVTGGAILTDFKFFVRPGSMLDVTEMNASASGTYHYADPDDVGTLDHGKANDFKFILELINWYQQKLGKVFLVLSSQMRSAERVTAEENRLRAQELDTAHGGTFSNFSQIWQAPTANLLMRDINVDLKGSGVEPVIITGLDAMGRTADNEKFLYLVNDLAAMQNIPEEVRGRIKPDELLLFLSHGRDVDITKLVMTIEEYQQAQAEQAAAQQAMMASQEMVKKAEPDQIARGLQDATRQQGG